MAKLVYGLMQSLDGYIDAPSGNLELPAPCPALFQHFLERTRDAAGSLYGRRLYELMRHWEEVRPGMDEAEQAFARAWQAKPKWVVSRTLKEVGPFATLVGPDLEGFVRKLKAEVEGEIEVGGPELAGALTELGLIDRYELYFRPYVLGAGKPFFAGPRPPLRLVDSERVGEDCVRLSYEPA